MHYMKTTTLILVGVLMSLHVWAEDPSGGKPKFNPEKFQAALEQFITSEAELTNDEATKFFPVYRMMMKQQRTYFEQIRRYRHTNPADERACREAIVKSDLLDIQIKRTQQSYHQKFLKILPAGKVFRILKAEERFHRREFKKAFDKK
ncbi:hypothetical protein HMPREF9135_1993 [Segatella baroniae F0067]|uniref:Uncharacterized protein n=1 Tax=Segatella baroniae F0067 TaxID=1115809 RepID=U2QE08_9BACT|nr:hypothetical protein [Segatella baroniae]ERK39543.1 hypothetical protein HMPREF9135_1993 [Segatella baroniae F0067]